MSAIATVVISACYTVIQEARIPSDIAICVKKHASLGIATCEGNTMLGETCIAKTSVLISTRMHVVTRRQGLVL